MSTQANVVLRFMLQGQNSIIGIMDKISKKKTELEKPVTVPIGADADDAEITIEKVRREADALNKKRAEFAIDANDSSAKAKLLAIDMRLQKLNKYLARPGVELAGLDSTLLGIYRIDAALDKVNGKKSVATVEVKTKTRGGTNIISRALGGGGSGGGGAFSGPFQGIAGVGSGASAGAIEALTSPVGASAAAVALPFIGTGVGGAALGALGSGLAGLGVAGGLGAGTSNPKDVAAAQDTLHAAQLRVIADTAKLNALQNSGKATTAQLASASGALARAQAGVVTAQEKVRDLGPATTKSQMAAQLAFRNLSDNAKASLSTIGASFAPVMATIFKVANSTLQQMTPVFAAAEKVISGPFQQVGTILAQSFSSPAVIAAVKSLASSFGEFLAGFAPQIPGIVNELANGITGMATAFTDHPGMIKGMGSVLAFLLKIPGFVAEAVGALTRVTSWLISGLPHAVSIGLDAARNFFIDIGHGIEAVWNRTWARVGSITAAAVNILSSFWSTITGPFIAGYNFVIGIFDKIKNFITTNFDAWWANNGEAVVTVWRGIWLRVSSIVSGVWAGILAVLKGFVGAVAIIFLSAKAIILEAWNAIWFGAVSVLRLVWPIITGILRIGWEVIKVIFFTSIATIRAMWTVAWGIIRNVVKIAWAGIVSVIKIAWDVIVGVFGIFINLITGRWHNAWVDMKNMMVQIWNAIKQFWNSSLNAMKNVLSTILGAIVRFFAGLGNRILDAIGNVRNILYQKGKDIVQGLWDGLLFIWHKVTGFISGIGKWIKDHKGPLALDHGLLVPAGKAIMSGFVNGLVKGYGKVTSFIGGIASGIANVFSNMIKGAKAGVGQWMGIVLQALKLNGLPASLAGKVLYQISTESGGNPNAINLTDINAQHGDPSRGLLQTIGSTFAAYHIAGTSNNIYDPLANVAAAINYAKHVYGPNLGNAYSGIGSGHGYAMGTEGAAQGWAWVGERGPELVKFSGGETVLPNHALPGYAKGTHITEMNAGISLYLAYIHADLLSIAKMQSQQRTFLKDISKYYSGSALAYRDRLVNRQTAAMETTAKKITNIEKNYATAQQYSSSTAQAAKGFGALSNIDITTSSDITGGLYQKLIKLKQFAAVLKTLSKRGYSRDLISQIVAMGPEQGLEYGTQLARQNVGGVNKVNAQIGAISGQIGRQAAISVYGIDVARGIAAQERPLKAMMRRLGAELGKEAALWFHVPKSKRPRGYALGTSSAARGWAWVGENGPELMHFNGGESVIPHGAATGGGNQIILNIYPTPMARPADIGREVVGAIREYERGAGKSWRTSD